MHPAYDHPMTRRSKTPSRQRQLQQQQQQQQQQKQQQQPADLKQRPISSRYGGRRDVPTVVYASVMVTSITAIDSALSTFDADFYVALDWEDERIQTVDGIDLADVWNPGVAVLNARSLEEGYTDADYAKAFILSAPGCLHYEQRYTGSLSAPMALHRFPFDQQVLTIDLEPAFCQIHEVELRFRDGAMVADSSENSFLIDWSTVMPPMETAQERRRWRCVQPANSNIDHTIHLAEWFFVRTAADTDAVIQKCRQIFHALDATSEQQDGYVSKEDFYYAIKEAGIDAVMSKSTTTTSWKDLFERFDWRDKDLLDATDGSGLGGVVAWDEVKRAITPEVKAVAFARVHTYESDKTQWSELTIRFAVIRQWKYYAAKICIVLILISLLAFPMFELPATALESRVNLILTLFLAATAFQFVIAENLPKIGYLTLMDNYLMFHNIILLVLVFECMFVNRISMYEETTSTTAETAAAAKPMPSSPLTPTTSTIDRLHRFLEMLGLGFSDGRSLTAEQVDNWWFVAYGMALLAVNGWFFGVGTRIYRDPLVRENGLWDK